MNLRGITVQGIGFGGGNGLQFDRGSSLTVTNCVLRNHTGTGFAFRPNVLDSISNLSVVDTLIADNGGDGIIISPLTIRATIRAVIDRVHVLNNSQDGVSVFGPGNLDVTVTDSVSANNGRDGFGAFFGGFGGATPISLTVIRSVSAYNQFFGLFAHTIPEVKIRFSQSVITGNGFAWRITDNSVLQSFGDNYIVGNADGDPAPPLIATK